MVPTCSGHHSTARVVQLRHNLNIGQLIRMSMIDPDQIFKKDRLITRILPETKSYIQVAGMAGGP